MNDIQEYTEMLVQFQGGVTTAVILIAWIIVMLIEKPSFAFFIITGIWVAHMLSYGIVAFIEENKN